MATSQCTFVSAHFFSHLHELTGRSPDHSEIDDFTQEWTFEPNSFDYVHMRFLIGSVTDWDALFAQAFKVLKPGGWVETLDNDGFFCCDDDTMPLTSAMGQWGGIFREGAKAMGLKSSFAVISEGLQRTGLEKAGFVNIHEKLHKVRFRSFSAATTLDLKKS